MILAKMKKKINEKGSQAKEKTTNQNQASLLRGYFYRFQNYKHLMIRVDLNQQISRIQIYRTLGLRFSKVTNFGFKKLSKKSCFLDHGIFLDLAIFKSWVSLFSDLGIFLNHEISIPVIDMLGVPTWDSHFLISIKALLDILQNRTRWDSWNLYKLLKKSLNKAPINTYAYDSRFFFLLINFV